MNNTKAALKQHGTAQRSRRSATPAAHTTAKAKAQQQPKTEAKAVGYYPNYMRKQRKVLTPGELKRADAIMSVSVIYLLKHVYIDHAKTAAAVWYLKQ